MAAVLGLFVLLIGLKGELHQFLSLANVQVLVHEATIPAVVALGMLLVIVSGGIDLSVGSVMALVTVVTMQVYRHLYRGPDSILGTSLAAIAAGILIGGLCGLTNGLIITRLRVAPFVDDARHVWRRARAGGLAGGTQGAGLSARRPAWLGR